MLLGSDEKTVDITANAYDSAGSLITTITLTDVPMKRNRVTTATGTLFDAGGSSIFSFSTGWLEPYAMTF